MKIKLKTQAVNLRKKGLPYQDILREVPVAKSTLSYWLRAVKMPKKHMVNIQKKRLDSARAGSLKRKIERITKTSKVLSEAHSDIKKMDKSDLHIIGACLYWAEGAKQRSYNISQRVCFANSDPKMIKIFLLWLDRICNIHTSELIFELYVHKSSKANDIVYYWKNELSIDTIFVRIKNHQLKTNRKNIDNGYKGLLRITVRKSTYLNRRISGWIEAITKQWGVV